MQWPAHGNNVPDAFVWQSLQRRSIDLDSTFSNQHQPRGSRPPQMTSTVPRHHDLAERTRAIDGPIIAHKSCAPPTNLDAGELFQDFFCS